MLQPGLGGSLRYLLAGGLTRSYLAVQPSNPPARALPLIVVLHGADVTPAVEEERTGFYPLGIQGRAILVYPTGFAGSWDAGHGCCGWAQAGGLDDVGFVKAVVTDAMRHYRIDPHRLYLVGYSNGGKMALRIACDDPSPFAAVATYGAVPVSGCSTGAPVPIMLAASTGDAQVPYSSPGPVAAQGGSLPPVTQAVPMLVAHDRCSATGTSRAMAGATVTVATWSSCRSGKPVELVTYQGASHAWPGSTAAAPIPLAAAVAVPVQALMWLFLTGQRR